MTKPAAGKTLIIVESPTKAKTIGKFLGGDFIVQSSYGHIRDLPKSDMGVDVEHNFTPKYVIPKENEKQVATLKRAVRDVDTVILATDEDREGEAIAWHLAEALGLGNAKREARSAKPEVQRIVFHEITKSAIEEALRNPRDIDRELVEAQQARRILDRLVGYTLSPFLWRKVGSGLSAGRVQSVAVRLIVDRERAIKAFTPVEYWTIEAKLKTHNAKVKTEELFSAFLKQRDGEKFVPGNATEAMEVVRACESATFTVAAVEEKEVTKRPPPPFTTSTLQQEASRKLGYTVRQTMRLAQQLYEQGYITYMRTDSVNLATEAVTAIGRQVREQFGVAYGIPEPRAYKTKTKGAQEAHEAIRPTNPSQTPEQLAGTLDDQQRKLYELIWNRTMATQMQDAKLKRVGVDIEAASRHLPAASSTYIYRATGQTITFDGFLKLYHEDRDEPEATDHADRNDIEEGERLLPPLTEGEALVREAVIPEQHFTKPPPRYTEASLVKTLEAEGIGRPSTYAPTIATIQERGYIRREGRQLIPEDVAFLVHDLLAEHFSDVVDLRFTAKMEEELDEIAMGRRDDIAFLRGFYEPFQANVREKQEALTKADVSQERVLGRDPATGLEVLARSGRFGAYVQLGRLEDMPEIPAKPRRDGKPSKAKPKKQKPKSASLLKGQDKDALTFEEALALLSFPRALGEHEGETVTANLGRFGPYVKCGDRNASIPEGEDPTAITLDRALALCAEAAERKRKMAEPLRVLGVAPGTETAIQVKAGRFGPYVTDGTTHASIPKKLDPDTITLEEAVELLMKKRARGPGRGGSRSKRRPPKT